MQSFQNAKLIEFGTAISIFIFYFFSQIDNVFEKRNRYRFFFCED
jgi:hypothetical protein